MRLICFNPNALSIILFGYVLMNMFQRDHLVKLKSYNSIRIIVFFIAFSFPLDPLLPGDLIGSLTKISEELTIGTAVWTSTYVKI